MMFSQADLIARLRRDLGMSKQATKKQAFQDANALAGMMPPDMAAAMGGGMGGMPPGGDPAAMGGMPPEAMGGAMPPDAMAGMDPMAAGMDPAAMGVMPAEAAPAAEPAPEPAAQLTEDRVRQLIEETTGAKKKPGGGGKVDLEKLVTTNKAILIALVSLFSQMEISLPPEVLLALTGNDETEEGAVEGEAAPAAAPAVAPAAATPAPAADMGEAAKSASGLIEDYAGTAYIGQDLLPEVQRTLLAQRLAACNSRRW